MKDSRINRWKLFWPLLQYTGADKTLSGFVGFILLSALITWACEPGIASFGDALWYCYAVVTTVGFGDITVQSPLVRVISVLLSVYAVLAIAIITSVAVNYFSQVVEVKHEGTLASLMEKLERLPELSKDELTELSTQIKNRKFR